jgi:predicted Rossmann fold flavoprotein
MALQKRKVIVVGGGASGLMAAGRAAEKGASVTLIEKNKLLGKKILISGKGRCNVTNDCDIEEIISNFPGNGKFLYGPLYSFSNVDLITFFNKLGVELKRERGGRVFPKSDSSKDIVDALKKFCSQGQVNFQTGISISEILIKENKVYGVLSANNKKYLADKVIIATGGVSFPGTGSTGDGFIWAEKMGHTIIPLRPSLIPLEVEEIWIKELQGLSLKNVSVMIKTLQGKEITKAFGEMLFTHYGVSGPIILTMSRNAVDYWQKNIDPLILTIDLKPALNREQVENRLKREIEKFSNKYLKNSLQELLPNKLIPLVIKKTQISPEKIMNQITKEERQNLVNTLKSFDLKLVRPRPINEAIVTAGGVNIKEINPQTMESKIIKGVYFAGEVLDIDGITGGFNLQAAFSTGFVAGESAAQV